MTWRGVFAGSLALIALEAVLRTNQSASRVGSFLTISADLVRRAMSPAVPAIPEVGVNVGGKLPGSGQPWNPNLPN